MSIFVWTVKTHIILEIINGHYFSGGYTSNVDQNEKYAPF